MLASMSSEGWSDSSELRAGTTFGSYRIEGIINRGGMGIVYRALDAKFNRPVAIKFLSDDLASPTARRRFQREAQLATALNHPHILTVHDVGEYENSQYLVMEYIDGGTLKDWLRQKRSWRETLELLVGVADALACAHQAGILHRDIKPANILVTRSGYAKLADFGLAKLEQMAPHEATLSIANTSPGMVVGTIAYMSPEQASGKPLDPRSDVFSFGIVLYEALSGARPFLGNTDLELLQTIIHAPPQPIRGEMPDGLRALIIKALEKEPARRYQSTPDMVADLRGALRDTAPAHASSSRLPSTRTSVAVLPFRLLAGAPADEFLCAALADAVVNRLAATGRLFVRPTASVMRYAQTPAEWEVVAREMNVEIVVDATIQKLGPRLRVLIGAHQTGESAALYSAKHDGSMEDLFGFQDVISESVCAAIVPQPPKAAEPARPPTQNTLAYELYMRAADRISRLNKWDTQTAVEMLTSATQLDPNFADAWAHLAQACIQMGVVFDNDPQWFARAQSAVEKSLALDQANADAFCAQAQFLWTPSCGFQNRQALRALGAALKINPGCHQAQLWRGLILLHLGLYVEARLQLEEALATNPGDMRTLVFLGQTALYRGDYETAYDFNARALSADPAAVWPNIFFPTIPLYLGRPADAVEKVRVARQMLPDEPALTSVDAMIAAHQGDFAMAEKLADEALQAPHSLLHTHHLWHNAAAAFAMSGKPEKAMPLLERCAHNGLPNYLLFGSDPHLRALHNRPEFLEFMKKLSREHKQHCEEFGSSDTSSL
jgi:TolB-like protein/tetratricopeptide (TPR) repeat protein/predicted Ser/Thr protein kinase